MRKPAFKPDPEPDPEPEPEPDLEADPKPDPKPAVPLLPNSELNCKDVGFRTVVAGALGCAVWEGCSAATWVSLGSGTAGEWGGACKGRVLDRGLLAASVSGSDGLGGSVGVSLALLGGAEAMQSSLAAVLEMPGGSMPGGLVTRGSFAGGSMLGEVIPGGVCQQ